MRFNSLDDFIREGSTALAKGPVALILAEDDTELAGTIRHARTAGFATIILFAPDVFDLPDDIAALVVRVTYSLVEDGAGLRAVNAVNDAAPAGTWLHYCFNAEYLFFPFCETRTVGEMLAFHAEERRAAMLTYVIDIYAPDLDRNPDAVSVAEAHLDRAGYYALARPDPENQGHPRERQLDFFGGLRWRFEEHVPEKRRKIDRISLFRSRPGLRLRDNFTFSDEELNTYACPWHNNLTACVCSFRTAKALKRNPGSRYDIPTFRWHNSVPFDWHSRQLLDLGLMEPGQWF
ncbi:hypothetical protein [Pseudooceanicola aestuarii]|uniref:hypothetical protein n=1 Tax=Pseudooceanicola aestuarii TaxID=2697319 RepID=UPI0013CFE81C|nr:hypothetical protein [Pseudooceanicola aestuarii]